MGLVYVDVMLANARGDGGPTMHESALVDTGANFLCIPWELASRLGFDPDRASTKTVETADGLEHHVPYIGPIHLRIETHECFVGALVIGDQVLLGAMPLQDMSLVVEPLKHTVRAG